MNMYNYLRYLRTILHRGRPRLVIIDITSSCNSQCLFCPRTYMPKNRKNGIMTKAVFDTTLREIKKYGIKEVRLYSTGEPLLHPDFDHIIRRLHDEGLHITVSTNGSMVNKHRDALMLVDYLQFSIDGWDKESYEHLRPPHPYEKIRQEITDFITYAKTQSVRPHITINLLQTLKTDVHTFKETWAGLVDEITINPLLGTTYYNGNRFLTAQPLKNYMHPFNIDTSHGCQYPFDILSVAYDGRIVLCCQDFNAELPLGHIDDGIKHVFNSVEMKQIRKGFLRNTPTVCSGCSRFCKVKN